MDSVGLSYERSKLVGALADKPRGHLIPFGTSAYFNWDVKPCIDDAGWLHVGGSLKNYDDEIEAFVAMLPAISTEWDLEHRYEEAEEPTRVKGNAVLGSG